MNNNQVCINFFFSLIKPDRLRIKIAEPGSCPISFISNTPDPITQKTACSLRFTSLQLWRQPSSCMTSRSKRIRWIPDRLATLLLSTIGKKKKNLNHFVMGKKKNDDALADQIIFKRVPNIQNNSHRSISSERLFKRKLISHLCGFFFLIYMRDRKNL